VERKPSPEPAEANAKKKRTKRTKRVIARVPSRSASEEDEVRDRLRV
jgi:hypothetical protein